tara:strand:- start:1320 stop:2150 length:831 start_codon:yes stop_codon:yes gene_type:complete
MWAATVTSHHTTGKKTKITIPLEKHIANMRAFFAAQRREIPALQSRRKALSDEQQLLTKRYQHRTRLDMQLEISQLQTEIETRKQMTRENEYELMIAPYLAAYNQRVEVDEPSREAPRNITAPGFGKKRETIDTYVQQSDANTSRQTALVNEYLSEMNTEPPKLALNTRDECPLCHHDLVLVSSKAIMTCPKCGYAVAYLDATMQSMSYSDDVEFSSFSYKRSFAPPTRPKTRTAVRPPTLPSSSVCCRACQASTISTSGYSRCRPKKVTRYRAMC